MTESSAPAEPVRERPNRQMLRNDALIAVGIGATSALMAALALAFSGPGDETMYGVPLTWGMLLGSFLFNLPLSFRRRWPTAVGIIVCLAYPFLGSTGYLELTSSQVTLFLAVYSIGAWEERRSIAFISRLAIVIGMGLWLAGSFIYVFFTEPSAELGVTGMFAYFAFQVVINIAYFAGAWIFGDRAWKQAVDHQALQHAHEEIRLQQEQLTDQAVSLERVRIARELHDVVAHHVSAMGIQAGAARRVLERDPATATASLKSVEQSARDAIAELRTMVFSLRSIDESNEPMPGLADVPDLIATARESGQIVELHTVGTPRTITPVIELTAYRILQEALTNARKHAGPLASVDARIRYLDDALEVEVTDDGHGSSSAQAGTGMGLVGMTERVAAVGGTLNAAPRRTGGWLVRATLPTHLAAASDPEPTPIESTTP